VRLELAEGDYTDSTETDLPRSGRGLRCRRRWSCARITQGRGTDAAAVRSTTLRIGGCGRQ